MEFELAQLSRQLHNLIRPGTIAEVDCDAARVRVTSGDLLTGWLPWLTTRAGNDRSWWAPEVGEQVLLLCPAGNPAQGYALPAIYQAAHPANGNSPDLHRTTYSDGAIIEYHRGDHHLAVTLPAGGTLTLSAQGGIHIEGDITVEGDVIADGISLKHHTHGGVMAGGATTSEPVT
ncbi:MAG: phage baseplate assembly protein V [Candidatus Sedimenticola sp. (ex Thyasira tokunagai)]